ncbi:RIO kinase 2 [Sarotherodon galilaeus]
MAAFTWIQMSSLLILMLQFEGTTEQHQTDQTVTAERGHDVTLPCKNVIQGQHNCNSTTWIFSDSSSTVTLFELGQIKEAKPKSDRLSLSADCSLVIKKVTDQDVGPYTCRQFKTRGGSQEGPDFRIQISVINSEDVTTTKSAKSTIKPTVKINTLTTREELKTSAGTLTTASNIPSGVHSGFIIVPVGLAALLIIVVVIIRWKKIKENETKCGNNTELSLNSADAQSGTSQDTADADDGVSYASISFTKKTKNKSRSRDHDDDDDDTVTYSTVKASSSPAGVSTDPNNLYSTISYPKK